LLARREYLRLSRRFGGNNVYADHHVWPRQLCRRLKTVEESFSVGISISGEKCEANAEGRRSSAASRAP
jgi:hypothetical protein